MRRSGEFGQHRSELFRCTWTYKIGQMDVAIRVQKHVVRLDVAVDDALAVDIPQCTTELRDPKADCLLSESFPRYVKSQVAAVHQVDHQIPVGSHQHPVANSLTSNFGKTNMYSTSWKLYRRLQMKG